MCKLPLDSVRIPLLIARIARDYAASEDKGLSCGPRKIHVAGDVFFADKGIHVFQFGAYGCTHVLAFGHLEDALEEAAAKLAEVAPGCFETPDYTDAANELGLSVDSDDESEQEQIREQAEQDLTYTESGYLASWEWTVTTFDSPEEVRAYAANK